MDSEHSILTVAGALEAEWRLHPRLLNKLPAKVAKVVIFNQE